MKIDEVVVISMFTKPLPNFIELKFEMKNKKVFLMTHLTDGPW